MGNQSCSIAITTHNRKEDLSVTLEWLKRYREDVAEIIVCADGCTDGTQDFVRQSYPEIVLMENNPGRGSIPSRNRMIRAARSGLVLLLDDDGLVCPALHEVTFGENESKRDEPEQLYRVILTYPSSSS